MEQVSSDMPWLVLVDVIPFRHVPASQMGPSAEDRRYATLQEEEKRHDLLSIAKKMFPWDLDERITARGFWRVQFASRESGEVNSS